MCQKIGRDVRHNFPVSRLLWTLVECQNAAKKGIDFRARRSIDMDLVGKPGKVTRENRSRVRVTGVKDDHVTLERSASGNEDAQCEGWWRQKSYDSDDAV